MRPGRIYVSTVSKPWWIRRFSVVRTDLDSTIWGDRRPVFVYTTVGRHFTLRAATKAARKLAAASGDTLR